MYQITKEFHFSASHILNGLPEGHPCSRMHGHNYIVVVVLESDDVDSRGFVVDFGDLKPLKEYIDNTLDHRHLNDVYPDMQPSAENLARRLYHWCARQWPQTAAVRVSETPKTWAEFRR